MSWELALVVALGLALAAHQGLRSARDKGPKRDEIRIGVQDGQLAPCPDTPNCISTQALLADAVHYVEPVPYAGPRADMMARLLGVLHTLPRVMIIEEREDYLRAEFRTLFIGFVDDVEFFFPAEQPVVHIRSASRVGHGDLGTNRRRYNQLSQRLTQSEE